MWRTTAILAVAPLAAFAAESPADFFEIKVRPVLAKNCFACHTQSKLGGLAMTSREALLKGGNSGPAIAENDPENSLLIKAVTHQNQNLKMPPSGAKLSAAEIDDLKLWIKSGAVWPAGTAPSVPKGSKYVISEAARQYWAFQPVAKPTPPAVKNKAWVRTPIDNFILAALEAKNLQPAPQADKRTLIRRATLDLTGLPPTPEEIDEFLADKSPGAFAKVVDRLLASPHYGERWGRIWLDVARYSDDKLNSTMDEPQPNAFRYRDWVIDAFNKDMPYDTFVKAQIAGDLMGKPELIAGTGLYGLSPEFQDDRVDVTTRGFLALTVACAQCHDHKFDPIPTKDYYSLLGIFNSSKTQEFPLADKKTVDEWQGRKKTFDAEKTKLDNFYARQADELSDMLAAKADQYLLAAEGKGPYEGLDAETIERFRKYLARKDRLAKIPADPVAFREQLIAIKAEKRDIDEKNNIRLGGSKERNDLSQADLLSLSPEKYYLYRDFFRDGGVFHYKPGKIDRFLQGTWREHVELLKSRMEIARKELPEQYPFLHALTDKDKPKNEHVYIRGNKANLGEEAPRGWLTVLSPTPDPPRFNHGSGRLELAESIASKDNPLTARVMVNRIWQGHFGEGIVRTASNFGRLGETPSHPELLDWLARRFMDSNWSIKAMHREILLSSVYQTASVALEGENRLLQSFPARRVDAESLRDSVLAVSGLLDQTAGGKPFRLEDSKETRRTVYGFVSRRKTDTMLNLFDFPNPNATSERRAETDVPLQRLFLLNSALMMESASALDKQVGNGTPAERVQKGYRRIFGRSPSKQELELGLAFTKGSAEWPQYWQVLLGTDEFLMLK